MTRVWRNGQWTQAEHLQIAHGDRGLLYGLGLFETLLAINGSVVYLDRHLTRLKNGCKRLGWTPEIPDITGLVAELGGGRFRVRLSLTGGSGRLDDLSLGANHMWMLTASPATEAAATKMVNISPFTRNERSPLAGLKCASYAENLLALELARQLGFEETLLFSNSGHLCEAATANVFLVSDNSLSTPALECGCLPGITRAVIIEQAAQLGIPCREAHLTTADLHAADGIFLTSSVNGVTSVSRLEKHVLPPCKMTAAIRRAWEDTLQECAKP